MPPKTETTETDHEILTEPEAAEFLRTTQRTVITWRHERGLPYIKINHKCIRYRRADLRAWVDRHMVERVA